ncbi:hypothetical protein IAQ61_000910 [Plenodomus lingam]|uniref:uncharacterized protein n=1 Tax=Leptosphaeria maculans TaxID=5022 RepID=UPI0033330CB9|nr:hypothetical protein IAQ61_000910 [Plenodomus lingam]
MSCTCDVPLDGFDLFFGIQNSEARSRSCRHCNDTKACFSGTFARLKWYPNSAPRSLQPFQRRCVRRDDMADSVFIRGSIMVTSRMHGKKSCQATTNPPDQRQLGRRFVPPEELKFLQYGLHSFVPKPYHVGLHPRFGCRLCSFSYPVLGVA